MEPHLIVALGATALAGVGGIIAVLLAFRNFYVSVQPDEYVVHYRGGRVKNLGRGLSFFCLPYDTYLKVPSTIRDINFCADQITQEKQGVRVQGFLAYKIANFELAYQSLDLKAKVMRVLPQCAENIEETAYDEKTKEKVIPLDPSDPLAKTDLVLRRLAESVVRHEVSNKTVEEMITERESVIQSMKTQLQETVLDWGIEIDTIEFTEVWVRSKELFESLQADYRNRMRLQAAQSNTETERQIAEKKIETAQEVAALEARSERLTRVTTSEEQRLARTTEIADQAKVHELQQTEQAAAKRREIETQREIEEREKEKEFHLRRKQLELAQAEELARLEAQMAEQQEAHQVDLDRRAKTTEVRVGEVETARRLAELKKQAEIQEAELERQKAEAHARLELERQQAEAERRRLEAETRAAEIERLAHAERNKALELAEAVKARGIADAEALRLRVEAENVVQPGHLQKLFIKELPKVAEAMSVKDVRWVNLAGGGSGGEDPLGIVPRSLANMLGVFQGMGMDLGGMLGGPSNDTGGVDALVDEEEVEGS